jgi:hypothetical protein
MKRGGIQRAGTRISSLTDGMNEKRDRQIEDSCVVRKSLVRAKRLALKSCTQSTWYEELERLKDHVRPGSFCDFLQ